MKFGFGRTLFKNAKKIRRRLFFLAQIVAYLLTTVVSPSAYSLNITILQDRVLRSTNDSGLVSIGTLPRGSMVQIPDQYAQEVNSIYGHVTLELVLMHWLQKEGRNPRSMETTIFPVKVIGVPKGTPRPHSLNANDTYYISLGYLARYDLARATPRARALTQPTLPQFQVTENAPVYSYSQPRQAPVSPTQNNTTALEGNASCPNNSCQTGSLSHTFKYLNQLLHKPLAKTDTSVYNKNRSSGLYMRNVIKNFNRTCGMSFSHFARELNHRAKIHGVPADLLMSMMTLESSGNCKAVGDKGRAVGLFQITHNRSRFNFSQLRNPLANLSEAIRILKQKAHSLTRSQSRFGRQIYNGFSPAGLKNANGTWSPAAWRLAASAYNGGELWVLRAKRDLEQFNRKHRTHLNPYNWEDLRPFYMRRHLDRYRGGHSHFFGERTSTGRSESNALINLSYAETAVPRSGASQGSLTANWSTYIRQF